MGKRSLPWKEVFLSWFMTIGIPYALIWEGLVVLPYYHTSLSPVVFVHVFIGTYLVFLIMVNFHKVVTLDTSVKPSSLAEHSAQISLPFCTACQVYQPVRSYHCQTCRSCIEKRDHHCLFTGCCIGLQNHRFFVSGVLAVFVGAVYGVVYHWAMVVEAAGGSVAEAEAEAASVYSLWLPLQLTAPHLVLPFGVLDLWGFVACLHSMLGLAVLVNAGVLLYIQLRAVLRGQTQYERKHSLVRFDRGWRRNVRLVLGERWLLALLWPFADSPLPDGAKYGE